jgi:peptidoglycan/LPS O-acetylase OafA/YrhL
MLNLAPMPVVERVAESEPSDGRRIALLDGWRGLAILLVLQSHFLPNHRFDSGRMGVCIFFSLSGMLMSEILFVRRVPLGTFYRRRISRVLPAFVVFVCIVFGISAWRHGAASMTEFLATLLFLRTYVPADPGIWQSALPIGHIWSLNVEEHCYLFLGVLSTWAAVRGREATVLAIVVLASFLLYAAYLHVPSLADIDFELRTEVASAYLLASAAYHLAKRHVVQWVKPWMPLATLTVAAVCFLPQARWWETAIVAPLALAFTVNHLQGLAPVLRRVLELQPVRLFGLWSYSIYLWQQPFYLMSGDLPSSVTFAGAMAAGLASFYLLEQPLRSWLNTRWT